MRNYVQGYYHINSCHDTYAAEIRYHPMCWEKYITYKDRDIPLQKVRQTEVRILMLKHVKEVIFQSNEPRSLKCLSNDYNILLTNYNMDKSLEQQPLKKCYKKNLVTTLDFTKEFIKTKA